MSLVLPIVGCSSQTPPSSTSRLLPTATAPVVAQSPRQKVLPPKEQIKVRYEQWKQSWQSMALDDFMSFYSPRVRVGKSTRYVGLRERKRSQWEKESFIRLSDVTQPEISVKGHVATLSVQQEYDSTTWWDKGIKRLTWEKNNGRWLIVRERFTAQDERSKLRPTPTPEPEYDSSDSTSNSDYSTESSGESGSESSGSSNTPLEENEGGCSTGATAICRDGSVSYSANRRGTCSHHGGVAVWCN